MKIPTLCTVIMFLIIPAAGGLYGIGEKTISVGGAAAWNSAEVRAGLAEIERIRPRPVLVLASTGRFGGDSAVQPDAAALDLSLSFDEGSADRFRDGAGHYRVIASPALEAADRRFSRAGLGAALFPGGAAAGAAVNAAAGGAAKSGGPLLIEPQSRDALFAPGSRIGDFSLEFWLYPLNMENGEQILLWVSSRQIQGGDYAFQRILCVSSKNRLQWSFLDFFVSPDSSSPIDIQINGVSPVVPKTWSHHLIRFDSATGMIEYLVNGKTEAIEYANSTGHEGGEVYTPIAGQGGGFVLGGNFMGLMDEFRIHGAWLASPLIQKYTRRGGRMETRAIDLGESGGVITVDARGGRTSLSGNRISSEYRESGRFRFADDSELQFFIRASGNPYRWDDSAWQSFIPGAELAENIRGRYVQLAVDFYPSADGESTPYLEELRITYLPDEPPLPPASLVAVAADGGVQLRWKSSPDSDTAGYLVYYGVSSDDYFCADALAGASPIDAGKRNGIFIDGLKNGTLYYFRVAAYDRRNPGSPPSFHAGEFSREERARPLQGLSALSLGMSE